MYIYRCMYVIVSLLLSLLLGSCLVELLEFGQRRNVLGGSAAAHSACGNCNKIKNGKFSTFFSSVG